MRTETNAPTGERNRLAMVVEIAIRKRLKEPPKRVLPRPNIEELEKILNNDDDIRTNILPDGRVEVLEPTFAKDLAEAALASIYADGWKIVKAQQR